MLSSLSLLPSSCISHSHFLSVTITITIVVWIDQSSNQPISQAIIQSIYPPGLSHYPPPHSKCLVSFLLAGSCPPASCPVHCVPSKSRPTVTQLLMTQQPRTLTASHTPSSGPASFSSHLVSPWLATSLLD